MTTVLVMTCNKFKQVWDPFFILFKKYWPDCPYDVVMGTDVGEYDGIKTISVGNDLGWVQNCIYVLRKIASDRIIVFFEDFLPTSPFQTDKIKYLVEHSIEHNIGCLRLQPCPGPTAAWEFDNSLGVLQKSDAYRFSWQTAIWDRKFLLSLLVENESPWQSEIEGTKRARKSDRHFVSVKRGESPTPYFITAVVKGKWHDNAIELLKKENIDVSKITKIIG